MVRSLTFAVFLCIAPNAHCAIVSISQFTGAFSETWETFPNYDQGPFNLNDPTGIMSNNATISNTSMIVYQPSDPNALFGLGTSGASAQVSDGIKGMGLNSPNQTATIIFTNAVQNFGAFWGAATGATDPDPNTVTLSFFDESDNLMGTINFNYSKSIAEGGSANGALDWHGWTTTGAAIKRLTYSGDSVVIDGLQANLPTPVPEPASLAMLSFVALGAAGYGWRRRKQAA